MRKIRTALAGVWHAVFRDFSVRYKLAISVAFLVIAGVFETLFHFLFVLAVTGLRAGRPKDEMDIPFSAGAFNVPQYRSVNETNSCPQSLARGFIVSLVSAALFGAIADAVFRSAWMLPWDARIGSWFHSFQSRTLTHAMVLVSLFGDPGLLFVSSLGLAGVLLYLSFWRELFTAGVILAGGTVLHLIHKSAFHRARPEGDWLTAAQGYSFPSGHALARR